MQESDGWAVGSGRWGQRGRRGRVLLLRSSRPCGDTPASATGAAGAASTCFFDVPLGFGFGIDFCLLPPLGLDASPGFSFFGIAGDGMAMAAASSSSIVSSRRREDGWSLNAEPLSPKRERRYDGIIAVGVDAALVSGLARLWAEGDDTSADEESPIERSRLALRLLPALRAAYVSHSGIGWAWEAGGALLGRGGQPCATHRGCTMNRLHSVAGGGCIWRCGKHLQRCRVRPERRYGWGRTRRCSWGRRLRLAQRTCG